MIHSAAMLDERQGDVFRVTGGNGRGLSEAKSALAVGEHRGGGEEKRAQTLGRKKNHLAARAVNAHSSSWSS